MRWVQMVEGPNGVCPRCDGSGSEWRRRKDGDYDRRCHWPIGPCKQCGGDGGWVRLGDARKDAA